MIRGHALKLCFEGRLPSLTKHRGERNGLTSNFSSSRSQQECARPKRESALLAGSITSIKPGPFRIGTREDRAQRPCKSPAALQGLSGIGIPNRKSPARHIGPRCSILGKSGGGRTGGEP